MSWKPKQNTSGLKELEGPFSLFSLFLAKDIFQALYFCWISLVQNISPGKPLFCIPCLSSEDTGYNNFQSKSLEGKNTIWLKIGRLVFYVNLLEHRSFCWKGQCFMPSLCQIFSYSFLYVCSFLSFLGLQAISFYFACIISLLCTDILLLAGCPAY